MHKSPPQALSPVAGLGEQAQAFQRTVEFSNRDHSHQFIFSTPQMYEL